MLLDEVLSDSALGSNHCPGVVSDYPFASDFRRRVCHRAPPRMSCPGRSKGPFRRRPGAKNFGGSARKNVASRRFGGVFAADADDLLPWDDDFFDAVTLTGVLHHFFRPRDALAEIRRVLRPGGRLLVIDPCFFPPARQVLNVVLRIIPHDGDYHFYSARRAEQLLVDLGFDVRRTCRIGLWAYLVDTILP